MTSSFDIPHLLKKNNIERPITCYGCCKRGFDISIVVAFILFPFFLGSGNAEFQCAICLTPFAQDVHRHHTTLRFARYQTRNARNWRIDFTTYQRKDEKQSNKKPVKAKKMHFFVEENFF